MEENRALSQIFYREFYWSLPFRFFNQPYYSQSQWSKGRARSESPVPYLPASTGYFAESGTRDYSHEETYTIPLPIADFADNARINGNGVIGNFRNADGVLVAKSKFPFVRGEALYVRHDFLRDWLKDKKLALYQTLLAEGHILRHSDRSMVRAESRRVYSGSATVGKTVETEWRLDRRESGEDSDDE